MDRAGNRGKITEQDLQIGKLKELGECDLVCAQGLTSFCVPGLKKLGISHLRLPRKVVVPNPIKVRLDTGAWSSWVQGKMSLPMAEDGTRSSLRSLPTETIQGI